MSIILHLMALIGLPTWLLPIVIAAAIASATGYAYIKGRMDASANCREAELRAIIASMERDKIIEGAADLVTETEMARLEDEMAAAETRISDYEKELAARPDSRCVITDDDLRGLRPNGKR